MGLPYCVAATRPPYHVLICAPSAALRATTSSTGLDGGWRVLWLCRLQVFTDEGLIYMVQEYGEIDLARLLAKHDAVRRAAAGVDLAKGGLLQDNLDENFIRLYWQQMLQVRTGAGLCFDIMLKTLHRATMSCPATTGMLVVVTAVRDHGRLLSGPAAYCSCVVQCLLQAVSGVHDQRIVHSDLKPANFLLVEGQLKLIDFGIAKVICGDTTSIARESQVGRVGDSLASQH